MIACRIVYIGVPTTNATRTKFEASALRNELPRTTKSSLCPKCTVRCDGTEGTFSVWPHGRSWCQFAWPCAELASSNFWHAGNGAARRYSRQEHTYTHVDDDNHGKTGCQRTHVHRNSAREDVNGETGRNTRHKPKITESSLQYGDGKYLCNLRATLFWENGKKAEVDLTSCDSCSVTSISVIR